MSDAVRPLLTAIEIDPQVASYKDDLCTLLFSGGTKTDAISNFLATVQSDAVGFGGFWEAVKYDTNHVDLISYAAWVFATHPDPKLRNAKYAVRLATRACEMTGFQSHSKVLALAAAYAEDSRFDEAVSSAQLACSLASAAGRPDLLDKIQGMLALFRSHEPYRESIETSSH